MVAAGDIHGKANRLNRDSFRPEQGKLAYVGLGLRFVLTLAACFLYLLSVGEIIVVIVPALNDLAVLTFDIFFERVVIRHCGPHY